MDSYGVIELGSKYLSLPGLLTYTVLILILVLASLKIRRRWLSLLVLVGSLVLFNAFWFDLGLAFWVEM